MKELDFDELDRAVNSLMTNASKTPPPKKETEQTLTITPTIKGDDAPSLDTLDTKMSQINGRPAQSDPVPSSAPAALSTPSEPTASTSIRPTSSSVAMRRGRFMDMVRPGTVPPSSPVASAPVSRQGLAIEPSRPIVNDVTPPAAAPTKSKVSTPEKNNEPAVPQVHTDVEPDTTGNNSEWPDPLDIADNAKKDTSEPPLSSPFLPDTRVEKRPLGGVQAALGSSAAEPSVSEDNPNNAHDQSGVVEKDDTEEVSKQLPADPVKTNEDAPLPEELSGDVIALESDANTMAMPVSSEKEAVVADQLDALKSDDEAKKIENNTIVAPEKEPSTKQNDTSSEPVVHPIVPTGPISIPQQYREEPSTGDKESGAIYDTDTYHQPLAHPKKKKSGWMWVIWIVLFLAIGAAGGAALFFLGVF